MEIVSKLRVWRCFLAVLLGIGIAAAEVSPGSPPPSYPDNSRFTSQRFGEQFGIGVVTVTSLAQDEKGFLWIATQTGLFRYDGSRITRMAAVEPLVGHYIDRVLTAPDNSVWIEGLRGIARFHDDQFTPLKVTPESGVLVPAAQGLAVDLDGNVFTVVERGVMRANPDNASKLRVFGKPDGLDCKTHLIVAARDGSIWLTCGQKLGRFRRHSDHIEWDGQLKLPNERAFALIFDGAGDLWLRSSRHMYRLDRIRHKVIAESVAPANEEGSQPALDHNGELLVPSMAGLFWRHHGHWRVISDKDGLSTNIVQAALEDSEGTLWVGGYGTGLDHLTGIRDWSAWTKAEGLPDSATWATERDRHGRLWVATTHGIAVWCSDHWRVLAMREGLAGNEIRQLALAHDGSMWALALPGGITRVDPVSFRMQHFPSLQAEHLIFLVADHKGDIWVTSREKLFRFDGRAASPRPQQITLPHEAAGAVWYLDFSPGGVLWATGRDRLFRFDGKSWRLFAQQDGLLGTTITSLAAVGDDDVWVAYNDVVGVSRLFLDAAGHAHTEQYPWDYAIIGRDSGHRIWFNSTEGISVFTPGAGTRHFSQAEGLIWNDLSPNGFREESDGSFLIATTRGLAHYVPHSLATPPISPEAVITSVSLGKDEQKLNSAPQVDYSRGRFYAQFTPLLLNNSSEVTCRYRLAGLESSYVETNLREVLYSHLPAGSYEFMVQCRRDLLPWNPRLARYSFTILPPWWQTNWFRGTSIIAALVLIWLIVRVRTYSLNRRGLQLEQAVAERSAELVQKNRELEEISLTDPLTHARNRRYFYEMIPADAAHVLRHHRVQPAMEKPEPVIKELIFAMVDIDFFKFANDEHGHMAGDQLIQEIAGRLSELIRKSDVLVRWGGEEFLIVCRSTDRLHASLLCSRILEAVSANPYKLENHAEVSLTCSVGWAPFPWIPEAPDALTLDEVIEIADRALYIAKRTGRNQGVGLVPSAAAIRAPYEIHSESLRTANPPMADIVRTANPCGVMPKSKAASASGSTHDPES